MSSVRLLSAVLVATSVALGAQAPKTFRARLSTVPVEATTLPGLTGVGAVTAVLNGNKLTVNGTFKGLRTPATVARLHIAPKGLRGPAMADLTASKGTDGTIAGEVTLTPAQIDHLTRTRIYVQLHSEKAPEGNLWGWLLP
jgi:hypothetical protein